MESLLTSAFLNGAGAVTLVVLLFVLLSTGRLATKREVDALNKRIDHLESTNKDLVDQNRDLIEIARVGQDVMSALRRGAEL